MYVPSAAVSGSRISTMSVNKDNIFVRNPKKTLVFFLLSVFCTLDFVAGVIKAHKEMKIGVQDPRYHHDLRKMSTFPSKWGGVTYVTTTNSLGFKDRAKRRVSLSAAAGKKRILLMGDSFTEGVGYPYEKTFAGLLEERLGTGYEILNAAVQSYSPMLYYRKVRYLLEKVGLEFDELYVFIDISDAQDEVIYGMDFIPSERWPIS